MRKSKANVLVLTYWSFSDALIQTYTLPYVRMIRKYLPPETRLFMFSLEQKHSFLNKEKRLIAKQDLQKEGIEWIPHAYSRWGFLGFLNTIGLLIRLLVFSLRKQIGTLHSWCTPAGAIGYIISVFTGKELIIDSYEPHAESMVENGEWTKKSLAFRTLFWLEKKMSHRAKIVIGTTEGMRLYAKQKYNASFNHYFVKPAGVDTLEFSFSLSDRCTIREKLGIEGKRVAIYVGKFGGIYYDNEIFQLAKAFSVRWGANFYLLILSANPDEEITRLAEKNGFPIESMSIFSVPHKDVSMYLSSADFAINPVKPVSTKQYCTSIKDGEYWAMGLPVIIPPEISDDSQIIQQEGIGVVWQSQDETHLMKIVKEIEILLASNSEKQLSEKIRNIAIRIREFRLAEDIYSNIYSS